MTKAENSSIRSLPKEMRDQTRRGEILDAASCCMARHGFHGASMAEIATRATMSVGQIYRYFPSKEAVVHALVSRVVESLLRNMADTRSAPRAELPTLMAERFALGAHRRREDTVLMLEVMAEATRNPAVAQILRDANQRLQQEGLELLRHACPDLTETEARGRSELFAVLAEGTAMRQVIAIGQDKRLLMELYRQIIERALEPAH